MKIRQLVNTFLDRFSDGPEGLGPTRTSFSTFLQRRAKVSGARYRKDLVNLFVSPHACWVGQLLGDVLLPCLHSVGGLICFHPPPAVLHTSVPQAPADAPIIVLTSFPCFSQCF